MDTASENNEPPITVLYIKPVEFSQHETDEVITILQSWNLSMSTCDIILAGGIYTINHLECIEVEQVEEIYSGIGKTFIGEKAVFLNKLKAWRKDKNKPMVCDKQTESASQTSRILDWLENISTELSNLSRTSSIASGSHDFVETSLQNQYQLKPLLEGSVKGQFILSYYGKHNILDSKSQKDLCHIITDFYKNKQIRMTYADMGNWAKQIELLFPNEKSTTYFMPRKVGKKNPTGKLHSRWANIHEKTNENDCENIDHQLLIIEEENIETLNNRKQLFNYGKTEISNNSPPIEKNHIRDCSFKMNASQMKTFIHLLPLIIGDLIDPNDTVYKFLILLIKLIDMLLLPEFDQDDLDKLTLLIKNHHMLYQSLFNDTLKPKFHMMVHYPTIIKQLGPIKYLWCFRFEAQHHFSKLYEHNITSRINVPLTLNIKAALNHSYLVMSENFFQEELIVKKSTLFSISKQPYFSNLEFWVEYPSSNTNSCDSIIFRGLEYKKGYVLTKTSQSDIITVCEIVDIILANNNAYVACRVWSVTKFCNHFQSYIVGEPLNYIFNNLISFDGPPIHFYNLNNGQKVQGGLRLPLAGLAPPRVLMCSASMGAEGSVTLQLREAVQAPDSGASLDAALTIGYPDPEILADVLGSLQAAGASDSTTGTTTNYNILENKQTTATISTTATTLSTTNSNLIKANLAQQQHHHHHHHHNHHQLNGKDNTRETATKTLLNNPNTIKSNTSPPTISSTTTPNYSNEQTPGSVITATVTAATTTSITSTANPTVKKPRPKTASPTRHGPQQCQVCSKVFGNASALAKHKLTHSDERKYVCGMCSKAFKRQDHLNGHMLTHRNKKPYECKAEGCGKSYCDARSLRRHTENHHSTLATTPSTPNQNVQSTGPPTGLSLSPATANGDASSPHGATLIQYPNSDGSNSKSPSPSSPAGAGNEGLTRQQLDLISQIMQQTKQANASLTAAAGQRPQPRPRTWNMQAQLQQNQTKLLTGPDSPTTIQTLNGQTIPKIEQKPVECNLCHRKFKNIPALNGHMRLHGGYFKKDSETKKCEKKETQGPPLQTASVGVRALIEEKIISKRKDMKGAFVVPAPPLAGRRISDVENFKTPNTTTTTLSQFQNTSTPGSVSVTVAQPINTNPLIQVGNNTNLSKTLTTQSTSIETKDATLIELLKRGTKVAVKRTCSDPGQMNGSIIQNATVVLPPNGAISSPSTPTSSPPLALSLSGSDSAPLALTISQAPSGGGDVFTLAYSTDTSAATFFGENDVYGVPDTAMLLQAVDTIQLLHDTSASDQLDDIASLSDYTINENGSLTESVQLSQNFTPSRQLQAVLNSPLPESLAEFSTLHSKDYVLYGCTSNDSPKTQSTNSPLPSPLAYPTPPASHEAVAQASPFLDESHHFSDASTFFDDKRTNFLDENSAHSFFKENVTKSSSEMTDNEKILKLKNELFNESKSVLLEGSTFYQNQKNLLNDNNSMFNAKIDNMQANSPLPLNSSNFGSQSLSFLDEPQNYLDDGRNTSSPLSAAFFTATMSSAEEVKEALEEVLPNENLHDENADENDIDLYYLPSLSLQSQMMPNSDDPLLSSSPKDFTHHKAQTQKFDFTIFSPPSAKKSKVVTSENNEQQQQQLSQQIIIQHQQHVQSQQQSTNTQKLLNHSNNNITINKIPLTIHTTEEIIPKDSEVFLSPTSIASSTPSPKIMIQHQQLHSQQQHQQQQHQQQHQHHNTCTNSYINKKRHQNENYRQNNKFKSFLRKFTSSYNHYTPTPILDPQRQASGIFANLNYKNECLNEIKELTDIDFYSIKPKINVGCDYQAAIPPCIQKSNCDFYQSKDCLTWNPTIVKNEKALQRYLELSKSSAVPLGSHSEETALKTLLEAQGEIHIAIMSLLQSPSTELHQRWSSKEMEIFLHGLETHGKDFYKIANDLTSKTTADCIQLYYFWKKLCLNYKTTHLKQNISHSQADVLISSNSNLNSLFDSVSNFNSDNDITINHTINIQSLHNNQNNNNNNEIRPHICEMPDCSASFTSKAALHGHTRLHCIGKTNNNLTSGLIAQVNNGNLVPKDDFPCKVCGKVFNKVKSRSAHMKSHRPQETEPSIIPAN